MLTQPPDCRIFKPYKHGDRPKEIEMKTYDEAKEKDIKDLMIKTGCTRQMAIDELIAEECNYFDALFNLKSIIKAS